MTPYYRYLMVAAMVGLLPLSFSSTALEVSTAREARDAGVQFQIKLDAIQAAMEAAYNDLLDKHETLQDEHDALETRVASAENCAKQKKLYNGTSCVAVESVPAGTVALFKTASCPTGWTRDSWWDGRFPYGAGSSIGGTGGASTVKLSKGHLPAHTHKFTDTWPGKPAKVQDGSDTKKPAYASNKTSTSQSCSGCNGSAFSVLNPYRRTLFCRKL